MRMLSKSQAFIPVCVVHSAQVYPCLNDESDVFNPLITRLLLFPIPTIAAITGHAFAAGWVLALTCDYRIMMDGSKRNAWACMNEIHFAAPWPYHFAVLFRAKVTSPTVLRKFALEGARFEPSELLELRLVDELASSTQEVIKKSTALANAWGGNAASGVWGLIKVCPAS